MGVRREFLFSRHYCLQQWWQTVNSQGVMLLMEGGDRAAGCGCGVLPLHATVSHNS